MSTAAATAPTAEPATTSTPASSASAAPAKEISAMPWTTSDERRSMMKMPMTPPISPSTAAVMMELRTSQKSSQ